MNYVAAMATVCCHATRPCTTCIDVARGLEEIDASSQGFVLSHNVISHIGSFGGEEK